MRKLQKIGNLKDRGDIYGLASFAYLFINFPRKMLEIGEENKNFVIADVIAILYKEKVG